MSLAHLVAAGGSTCDFCSSIPIVKHFPCKNFEWRSGWVFGADNGWWGCCERCSQYVEAKRWPALIERSFQKFIEKHAVARHDAPIVRLQFTELVKLFSKHMMR